MKLKLTKNRVGAQKPANKLYKVHDTEVPGFSLRIYPSGRKAFFYRYRVGGGRGAQIREPQIGDYGSLTADQARKIAKDWAAKVRQGGDPAGERKALREDPTMSDLFDRYISDHAKKHKKPTSLANDTRMIEQRLRPTFGGKKVKSVTRQQIRAFHSKLEDTPYEANRVLALLSKIFSFSANDLEWTASGDHPVKGIRRFEEKKRKRYLSQAELARLGEALAKAEAGELERQISPHVIAMIRLLVLTGARHGEILTLRWCEVNLERGCLELTDSKTGEKEIYLSPAALQILSELPRKEDNPFVIIGRKHGTHLVNIKDPWTIIRKEAGLEDVRLHDLRHSFASVGARAGMSLPVIGALLGHRETATTARYAHLSDDPLRAAADSIGEEIAEAMRVKRNG
ncbi:tyrosine-type recombinase/integrase [Pseudohalocynthiibacter aestuariivivens]|uniref:Tyrosine-type recombinase/integrase n=1 Tax=Pseudohalocynthiibacter aestuariivivens TaxID=1591409 RepID=A0ABV5JB59_9RHOB|nr:site-specific integrase [Pseudohalocynthiibacter aestuariivivens]MBS9716923.1 tyrosine-type recombinase/integrase [Pseudohalocynthiibacter aestuariivivens]